MITAVLFFVVAILGLYMITGVRKPRNYPPGPKWYPFLGCSSIVQIISKRLGTQWEALSELAKEYSTQVLGLRLGNELVIVVYGHKNIRQVFLDKEFEGRPDNFFIRLRCLGKRIGITFADGLLWKEHRHFTVRQLRNVGFGKTNMEKEIQKELVNIIEILRASDGKPINPKSILAMAVMNVLWKYVAGERIEEDRLKYLLDLLNSRSKAFSMAGNWLNQAPWCRFIFPERSGYALIHKMNQELSAIIEHAIQKHVNAEIQEKDFIYSFLKEKNENKSSFTDEQLRTICLDLLIAGSQTTSNVIEFAILTVLRNKVLQDRIFDEINGIIGSELPCWADSSRLIYTSAFLLEVQRYYTIVPLAGPRRVLEDTEIDGYSIPKGTTVLIALRNLHYDPELWENPNEFNPERFIDNNGELRNAEYLLPFGLGRRRCPGDSLARSFIFIIFVGIMQRFKILPSNGLMPSETPVIGLISAAKPFTAEFFIRE